MASTVDPNYHRDITARPLRVRLDRLENVVAGNELVFPVRRLALDALEGSAQSTAREEDRAHGPG